MSSMKKSTILTSFVMLMIITGNANAALAPMLPESSYDDGNWYGYDFYDVDLGDGDYLRGRIDFGVYDLEDEGLTQDEQDWIDDLGLAEEQGFLYAYQVFNDFEDWSEQEVAYFSVFAEEGGTLDIREQDIFYEDDGHEDSVSPSSVELADSGEKAVWHWELDGGEGLIWEGEHSWYLLMLSDSGPVIGDYEIQTSETGQIPAPRLPEPATIMLFGLAQAFLFAGRKRNR